MTKTMISARIPEKLSSELEALAVSTRRSKAYLLTEALEDYVERKAWITREIAAAVKEADENGEWVSEEDMNAWLDTWGKEPKSPLPRLRARDEMP